MAAGAAVGAALGLLGGSALAKKPKVQPAAPAAPKPPPVPTTAQRAKGVTDAAEEAQLRRRTRAGRQSTILTSPLGTVGEANIGRKTLLGQ